MNEKFILIKAKSQYFEINEIVAEDKAVKRLKTIRKMYEKEDRRRLIDGKLSVTTEVLENAR